MPKSENSNPKGAASTPRPRPNWIAAAACFIAGAFISVALVFYDPSQSTILRSSPTSRNPAGLVGAKLVSCMLYVFGVSTWLLPFFLFWALYLSLRNARRLGMGRLGAMLVSFLALSGMGAMLGDWIAGHDYFPKGPGGAVGGAIYQHVLSSAFGPFGSALLLGAAYAIGLLVVFTRDIGAEFENVLSHFSRLAFGPGPAKGTGGGKSGNRPAAGGSRKGGSAARPRGDRSGAQERARTQRRRDFLLRDNGRGQALARQGGGRSRIGRGKAGERAGRPRRRKRSSSSISSSRRSPRNPGPLLRPRQSATTPTRCRRNLKILKEQVRADAAGSEEEYLRNAENLLRILGEFGVEVSLGEIHVGPVITRYELVPAPGVRVEKISGLDKNIALGMRAQSVRILAPIPGKAAVGVEVPNQHPTPVGLREILESDDWINSKAELPIALGKDVSGKPLISDLTKMPHLLIAGATGSGKSVCINAIIASILYSKTPREVRLFMVDPKVVELKIFNPLPHMLIPVLTEPKKVPAALKWLLNEMERRYQVFAKVNVRNILGFNSRKKGPVEPPPVAQELLPGVGALAADDGIEIPERLFHYIVVIIDELADLMMVAPAEIETNIARLAQLARGAGIHVIIATQRPSVDVITGVIKANLPSRIAFQVASQVDSRTIIDGKGADTLIGRGDMLFSPPGTSRLVRAQGAFVSDEEVLTMVEYIKENNDPPVYFENVQAQIDRASRDEDDGDDGDGDEDMGDDGELYQQAVEVLKSTRRASTSMLQRRLRIGYNRAARIMEIMEEKGIVGPENGSNPREILVDLDAL